MLLEAGTYAKDFLAAALDNDGDVVALCNAPVVTEFYQRVSEAVAWTMRAMGAFDMGTFLTSRSLPLESVTVMAEASSASEATRAVSLYVPVAGATRPYGTFIQEDHVFRDTAIPNDFIQTPKFCDWYKISPGNAVKTAPASK